MSETTAEYQVKDEIDIRKHIEQKCILGSFNRLQPILTATAESAKRHPEHETTIQRYLELERLALDLARYALDAYKIVYADKSDTKNE